MQALPRLQPMPYRNNHISLRNNHKPHRNICGQGHYETFRFHHFDDFTLASLNTFLAPRRPIKLAQGKHVLKPARVSLAMASFQMVVIYISLSQTTIRLPTMDVSCCSCKNHSRFWTTRMQSRSSSSINAKAPGTEQVPVSVPLKMAHDGHKRRGTGGWQAGHSEEPHDGNSPAQLHARPLWK